MESKKSNTRRYMGLIVLLILLSVTIGGTVWLMLSEGGLLPEGPTGGAESVAAGSAASETGSGPAESAAAESGTAEAATGLTPAQPTEPNETQGSGGQQVQAPGNGNDSAGVSSGGKNDPPATEPAPEVEIPLAEITCDQYSIFTGQYVEDGRDELVYDVAAILVTNQSDRFLEIATLTYQIDGREASFVVTGLHPGQSAWVLEANRMTASSDSVFTYVDVATGFRDDVTTSTDKLKITADGNMMTVKNTSGTALKEVYVYYKVLHADGNYLGGITYRVSFGTLEPGASATKLAGHYSSDAQVIRVSWLNE